MQFCEHILKTFFTILDILKYMKFQDTVETPRKCVVWQVAAQTYNDKMMRKTTNLSKSLGSPHNVPTGTRDFPFEYHKPIKGHLYVSHSPVWMDTRLVVILKEDILCKYKYKTKSYFQLMFIN